MNFSEAPIAFVTTRWSRVVRAGDPDSADAHEALSALCEEYWRPLYEFARRKGHPPADAQDLTQGFLAEILASNAFARAEQARGRFRTFLLGSFTLFLARDWRDRTTQKRGGGRTILSLDAGDGEAGFVPEVADRLTPEHHFERSWALGLLERIVVRLREEYERAGRGEVFEALQPHLTGGGEHRGFAEVGASIGLSEGAIGVALHRMRRRFGALLRAEVAHTVADADDVEDELRHLLRVVSNTTAWA